MASIDQIELPNGITYDISDASARKLDNNDFDTINVTELNAGDVIVTGAARFLNTINGDISGNAETATSATKATQDESGNNIKNTYASSFSISDHTITLKNKNGTSLGTVTVPDNNTTYTVATGTANGKIKVTPSSRSAYEVSVYGLKSAAYKDVTDSYSATGTDPVSGKAVAAAIDGLPSPMVFKGSLGTGGTITALPVDGTAKVGDTYKVITAGTYASKAAKVGDTFICLTKTSSANTWELIPSGDEPSGTVTSVAISNGGGLSVSGSPITSSGTITISHADTSSQASVDNSGRTYIQDISLDTYGHVTKITSATETVVNTDRYVNSATFADATSADANNPVKMTLTRAGSDTASVTAYIPKVGSSSAGVAPKGAAVSSQSQSTKFLREDGTWAAPSYTTNTNTTYTLGTSGNNVTLTPSSGSVQSITVPYATSAGSATSATTANQLAKQTTLDTVAKLDAFMSSYMRYASTSAGVADASDGLILAIPWSDKYGQQLFFNDDTYLMKHRYLNNGTWSDWKKLIDETNVNDYAPTKTGTGASGTWGISISGNAATATSATSATTATKLGSSNVGSATQPIYLNAGTATACTYTLGKSVPSDAVFTDHYAWTDITGKPSTFTPSSHTHPVSDLTWGGGVNLVPIATANGQEWSIDLTPGSYTGTYWQIWSAKNSKTIFACYPDDNSVAVPSGKLRLGKQLTVGGTIAVSSANYGNWNEGIRINKCSNNIAALVLGGDANSESGTADNVYFIGTYNNRKLYISHNGAQDGTTYFYADSSTQKSPSLQIGSDLRVNGVSYLGAGNAGTTGGISLYSTSSPLNYGIAMRTTTNGGKHGGVQGDWATYFSMNNQDNRGWIFRRDGSMGVASVDTTGNAVFNGYVGIGGNTTNTSGVRQVYNSTTKSLDFVFVA